MNRIFSLFLLMTIIPWILWGAGIFIFPKTKMAQIFGAVTVASTVLWISGSIIAFATYSWILDK